MGSDINMKGRSLLTLHDLRDEELLCLLILRGIEGKEARRHSRHLLYRRISPWSREAFDRTRCAATSLPRMRRDGRIPVARRHPFREEGIRRRHARCSGACLTHSLRGYLQASVELLAKHSGVPCGTGSPTNPSDSDARGPAHGAGDVRALEGRAGRVRRRWPEQRGHLADGGLRESRVDFVNCTPRELEPAAAMCARSRDRGRNGSTVLSRTIRKGVKGQHRVYGCMGVHGRGGRMAERMRFCGLPDHHGDDEADREPGVGGSRLPATVCCVSRQQDGCDEGHRPDGGRDEVFEARSRRCLTSPRTGFTRSRQFTSQRCRPEANGLGRPSGSEVVVSRLDAFRGLSSRSWM